MQLITEADLRAVLQLPNRPYSDPLFNDGSPYFDLSRREPTSILSASGSVSGGTPFFFRNGIDFTIHDGIVDWTGGALRPDLGTAFTVNYTFSRLASAGVSTSMFFADQIVTAELGPSYPYGTIGTSSTDNNFNYTALAKMMQLFVAAREACYTLASAEIDYAEKYRRGSVLVDDTKKTDDWDQSAKNFDAKYQKYLNLVRPGGQIHHFSMSDTDMFSRVFADASALYASESPTVRGIIREALTGGGTFI